MKEWAGRAVVLRVGHFRDADVWLKLLFRRKGLLTLFAFGGSRSRRRFCGCLDVLNSLHCRVRTSGHRDFLNLAEAVLLSGPQNLRTDWRRMGIAANCLRFVEALGVNAESSVETFDLVEDLRQTLEKSSALGTLLPLFFRLRFAGAQGFAPNLRHCSECGARLEEGAFFLVDEGQARCRHCHGSSPFNRYDVELPVSSLEILRHVQRNFPSAWAEVSLSGQDRKACARAIDGFVQYHLGLIWEGGFYRRL